MSTGTALALLVIAVALVPSALVLTHPAVRRELRINPALALTTATATIIAVAVAWRMRASIPGILPVLAAVLTLATSLVWWRARDGFGAANGRPPGSLSFRQSLDALTREQFYAEAAGRHGPVFKVAQFHRPVVCVADLRLGLDLLERHRDRLRPPVPPRGRRAPRDLISFLLDERHPRHRVELTNALTPATARSCADLARSAIDEELASAARATDTAGIDPRPLLDRITLDSLCRAILGMPASDTTMALCRALDANLRRSATGRHAEPESLPQLVRHVQSSGRNRLETLPVTTDPSLLARLVEINPGHLEDETLIGDLVLLAHVTRSNLRGVLGWVLKELLSHPEVVRDLRRLAESPDKLELHSTHVVYETLRRHQSEFIYRSVIADITVGSHRIPAGWLLRVCVRECHDDPSVFPAPHMFQPARFDGRSYSPMEFCPATDGSNSDFGAELVTHIASTFVRIVALQWEGRVVADGPAARSGNRHWNHWSPSPLLRISLNPRDPPRT